MPSTEGLTDGKAAIPLYQQVIDTIKNDINSGTYKAGARIPNEFELAESYKVGRVTVRRAIEELICIERVRTADGIPVMLENNTYVYEDNAFLAKADLTDQSIFEVVREQTGRGPAHTEPCTLEIACASPEVARLLSVPTGEPLFYMEAYFYDEQQRPFIIGRQRIVGSRYVFDI